MSITINHTEYSDSNYVNLSSTIFDYPFSSADIWIYDSTRLFLNLFNKSRIALVSYVPDKFINAWIIGAYSSRESSRPLMNSTVFFKGASLNATLPLLNPTTNYNASSIPVIANACSWILSMF